MSEDTNPSIPHFGAAWGLRTLDVRHLLPLVTLEVAAQDLPWSQRMLEDELGHPDAQVYGALLEDRLWAYAAFRRLADELWLMNLATHPTMRRKGLGRALVTAGLQDADASRISGCWLEVRRGNRGAQVLYERMGFEKMGIRPRYYPPLPGRQVREDAVIMRRVIASKDLF